MKRKNLDLEDSIIDSYYNEISENNKIQDKDDESIKIYEKLNAASEKLDSIEDIDFDLDINILGIIQNAEDIKVKKKNKIETLCFILTSFLILSSFLFLGILSGFKVLIYVEIIVSALLPFVVIPIAKIYQHKEGV